MDLFDYWLESQTGVNDSIKKGEELKSAGINDGKYLKFTPGSIGAELGNRPGITGGSITAWTGRTAVKRN
ncbi:hypothetical protein, partial [Bifidobacterium lemurum]|uniref:hypothetical protein n=1 Tax=Bifidobacterium lemurum TaxID=1603886 RepID=UPI001B800225